MINSSLPGISFGATWFEFTEHALIFEVEEKCYGPCPCTPCNVFDQLAMRIAFNKDSTHHNRATQLPLKHERLDESPKVYSIH